jgi:hypothetical protein
MTTWKCAFFHPPGNGTYLNSYCDSGVYILNPFRPLPGQWTRVRGKRNSLIDYDYEFVKSPTPS